MSEKQWNDQATSEHGPSAQPRGASSEERSHAIQGPHFASEPPRVLARLPNLESAESELACEIGPADRTGRMLSSRWSMPALAVVGATLLVAALALPFFVNGPGSPEPASPDGPPAWGPDRPAPSAALAPAWDGLSEGVSGWQQPSGGAQAPEAQAPAVSAWSEQSPPLDWDASSQAQPWDNAAKAQTWDAASGAATWADRPATPGWDGRSDTAVSDGRPPWAAGAEGASAEWQDQGGVAATVPPRDVPIGSVQPSPAPGVYREAAGTWNEDAQTPRWPVPAYRMAQQPQASGTAWDGGSGSAAPAVDPGGALPIAAPNQPMGRARNAPAAPGFDYEPIGPAVPGHESYRASEGYRQPQINTNRTMRIHAYPDSDTFDAAAAQPAEAQPVYRAADARANPWSAQAAGDARSAVPDAAGPSAFPTNGATMNGVPLARYGPSSPAPSAYPADNYRQTAYPPAASNPSADYRPTSGSPTSAYPTYGNPASANPAYGYPASANPAYSPAGQLPASGLPAADGASPVDPRWGATGPSVGATLPARDAVGGYPGYPQPGVARFQGGIEKPMGTEVHDNDRRSVY